MQKYLPLIASNPLFRQIKAEDLSGLLACMQAHQEQFRKYAYIFPPEKKVREIALILKGSVLLSSEDFFGNKNVIRKASAGELCGEAYAALSSAPQVNVQADEETVILFLPIERLTTTCANACPNHAIVIKNLLYILAHRNQELIDKFSHVSKRTTREKLMSYLYLQAQKQGSFTFTIPFSRQELADYLFVDRCAMSHELSKLRDEGYIEYHRNSFKLLKPTPHSL